MDQNFLVHYKCNITVESLVKPSRVLRRVLGPPLKISSSRNYEASGMGFNYGCRHLNILPNNTDKFCAWLAGGWSTFHGISKYYIVLMISAIKCSKYYVSKQ